jgi:hypothetical protein
VLQKFLLIMQVENAHLLHKVGAFFTTDGFQMVPE